jgi:AcrR family transcriptional regulator
VALGERTDQKHRTRQDLLQAAKRLMKAGRVPKLVEVAAEAMVSRATAYRYFSSDEALLTEAALDARAPMPDEIFAGDPSTDPEERLLRANAALREMVWGNQTQFRLFLARELEQAATANEGPAERVRQNRRLRLIEAALAPVRDRFNDEVYGRLCAALALVFGTESMVVFRDVLRMDDSAAWDVESWVLRVLTRAALAESNQSGHSKRAQPRAPTVSRLRSRRKAPVS